MRMLLLAVLMWAVSGRAQEDVALVGNAFHPREIARLVAHWDAMNVSGFTNGQNVSSWKSSVGGFSLTNGTTSLNPTKVLVLNQPAVSFDGVDDWLDSPGPSTLSIPITIYSVSYTAWVFGPSTYAPHIFDSSTGSKRVAFLYNGNLSSSNHFGMYNNGGGLYLSSIGDFYNKTFYALGYFNGASSRFFTNGVIRDSGDSGSAGYSPPFVVGRRYSHNFYLNGFVMEVGIVSGNISEHQRNQLDEYIKSKWRLK